MLVCNINTAEVPFLPNLISLNNSCLTFVLFKTQSKVVKNNLSDCSERNFESN